MSSKESSNRSNRSNRNRYDALSNGLCGRCYIRPVILPTVSCEKCTEVHNRHSAKDSKKYRDKYKENRRCSRCGAPLDEDEGTVTCMNCRDYKLRETMKVRKYATD